MTIESRPRAQRAAEFRSLGWASDFTGLTERSLRRYISEGKLAAYRVGTKQIRVRVEDVEALLVRIPTGSAA